ncbi:unnamed protein product [Linum trigynum]|uniref:Uncharacterized protein n=1 Tax=Linum trigynum TaxID=586398 RepID=A0AAV2EFT5_9ROSI
MRIVSKREGGIVNGNMEETRGTRGWRNRRMGRETSGATTVEPQLSTVTRVFHRIAAATMRKMEADFGCFWEEDEIENYDGHI